VINLFTDSVFWSFMSDFVTAQARLYGVIAAGGTATRSSGRRSRASSSARLACRICCAFGVLLAICLVCILKLVPWARARSAAQQRRRRNRSAGRSWPVSTRAEQTAAVRARAVHVLRHEHGTLLYNEQAAVVGARHMSDAARTEYFAGIDLGVNLVALGVQLLLTRVLLTRFGVGPLLLIPALLVFVSLGSLAFFFSGALLAAVQIVTRGLSFSFIKPARESLFTLVDRESRYKAKNFIDTVVYRGGDMTTSWAYRALAGIGLGLPALAGVWAGVAIIWGIVVLWIIRLQRAPTQASLANEGESRDQPPRIPA
jgi:AAA family ATP:ADP antiporter